MSDVTRNVTEVSEEKHQKEEGNCQLPSHLCKRNSNNVEEDESRNNGFRSNGEGLCNRGEQRSSPPSYSSNKKSSGIFNQTSNEPERCQTCSNDLSNVENGQSLRRCCQSHLRLYSQQRRRRQQSQSNYSQMGQTQNQQTISTQNAQLDCNSRGQLSRTSSSRSGSPSKSTKVPQLQHHHSSSSSSNNKQFNQQFENNASTSTTTKSVSGEYQQQHQSPSLISNVQCLDQIPPSFSSNTTTNSTLLQERCSGPSHQHGSQGSPGGSSPHHNHGETQGRTSRLPNNNCTLCSKSDCICFNDWYSKSDEASLNDFANSFSCLFHDPYLCNFHRNKNEQNTFSKISSLLSNNVSGTDPIYFNKKSEKHFNVPAKNFSIISHDNSIFKNFQKSIIENTSFSSPSSSLFSITKYSHSNSTATPEDLTSLPLHISEVKPLNISKIKNMMNPNTLHRYNFLKTLLTTPDQLHIFYPQYKSLQPYDDIEISYSCIPHLCKDIINKKIAEPASETTHGKTKGWGRVFFVKESKLDEDNNSLFNRLRFIFWPQKMNEWLKNIGYSCEALLYHISKYLDNILDDSGATADAASGFFQFEIPPAARCWFRFKDSEGNLYQLCRLPMGLSISVEIMQIIMEVLIGNPKFVKPQFVIDFVRSNAYVDDIRISGSVENVSRACSKINERALDCCITLKKPLSPSSSYTFLGGFFNHSDHTISLGEKLRNKIPSSFTSSVIIGKDFHSLIGRLIHATAMLRLPLVSYMMLIKWSARKFNQFNKNPKLSFSPLNLPPFAISKLDSWCKVAHSTRYFHKKDDDNNNNNKKLVVFLDASLGGWGTTVITPDLQLFHTGGSWSSEHKNMNINLLEAVAFRNSVISFADLIVKIGAVDFRIDNTSVESSVRRGAARKEEMINIIQHPIEFLVAFDITVTSSYVESKNNLADPISRQSTTLPDLTRDQVESLYMRKGDGGRW